jgi:hypothetical protein
MKSILEELWYGNICPETDSRTTTPEMKQLMEYMARRHGSLLTTINNGQKQRKNLTAWPSSFFISSLNQYPITMINFMLNNLRRPACEILSMSLHLKRLELHFDGLISLALARAAEKRKTTFFRLINT